MQFCILLVVTHSSNHAIRFHLGGILLVCISFYICTLVYYYCFLTLKLEKILRRLYWKKQNMLESLGHSLFLMKLSADGLCYCFCKLASLLHTVFLRCFVYMKKKSFVLHPSKTIFTVHSTELTSVVNYSYFICLLVLNLFFTCHTIVQKIYTKR